MIFREEQQFKEKFQDSVRAVYKGMAAACILTHNLQGEAKAEEKRQQ